MNSIGIQYNAKLQRLVRAVREDINVNLLPLVRRYAPEYTMDSLTLDGWSDDVARALQAILARWMNHPGLHAIAADFVKASLKLSGRKDARSFGIQTFGTSTELDDYLKAATWQNTQLIKSIPTQYLEQVGNILMTNMRTGMRPSYIEKELQQQFGVTQRRAKFIARDQTAKITGEINKKRQVGAGFEYFQWIDSHDQRVRHRHREIANQVTKYGKGVYRWDDLPLSDKGEPIQPGSDYQCRCIARPVSKRKVEQFQSGS